MKEPKRKITMTLSAEVIRTLDDYALLLNVSRSRLLDDILLQSLPSIKALIEMIQGIQAHPDLLLDEDFMKDNAELITKLLPVIS